MLTSHLVGIQFLTLMYTLGLGFAFLGALGKVTNLLWASGK